MGQAARKTKFPPLHARCSELSRTVLNVTKLTLELLKKNSGILKLDVAGYSFEMLQATLFMDTFLELIR